MVGVTSLPETRGGPFTAADLEGMPDDGRRYEILDGVLVVSPSPRPLHQRVVRELTLLLHPLTPVGLELFFAPLDVYLGEDTVIEPDLVVARSTDVGDRGVERVPVLAVEVLSPRTRSIDLHVKRARLEHAGCASYWIVDPDEPSITAWDLHGGSYVEAGHAVGAKSCHLTRPFSVTITPAALVAPHH
ncbi:Uma2 family endonuclease [Nocardioides mangrovicus]|uniref:Uma2 family endonuclease n=1 Tax=Nocardioides mangrovicus TaxID=2478913 RepID=A0A3L8P663_9ACTN|nr:Uma2 family endonuclease [Nocardioides mangrovicus]RLV50890.1 Uma2 family endonuclease [Nocardioides mangrovicus]